MPTPTYDLIASTTLAANSSTVTLGSLPQTYRDLILVIDGVYLTDGFAQNFVMRLNGLTSSIYSSVRMTGNGSTTASGSETDTFFYIGGANNNQKFTMITQFMDYSATDKHKTLLSRQDTPAAGVGALAHRLASTDAITSIQMYTLDAVNIRYAAGTTFSIYGVIS